MRTCRPVGPVRLFADCRNAAQCESLGHRPRNRFISNTNALKGQNWGRASSFRPVGAVCVSIHFSQGDALGFRILGLWPGTHSAPQCRELSRPLTENAIQLGCGRSPRQVSSVDRPWWVAGEAWARIHFSVTHILVVPAPPSVESKLIIFAAQQEINCE